MRGIQISEYVKSPADLQVSQLPDPEPSADQYLIQVHASAANFFDILQVQGRYQTQPPFPWVAGFEFAGTVIATPRSSSPSSPSSSSSSSSPNKGQPQPRFAVGDRVFGAAQGAFATHLCAHESALLPVPDGWSFDEAAGLFVTAPTSYAALVLRAGVRAGDYVLVHAAAGGVGLAAVQVAKAFGATVIATASTPRKLEIARSYGADHVITYSSSSSTGETDWPAAVKALTPSSRGVDIIFDPVGLVDRSTKCAAWNARILIVGFAAGAVEKIAMNKVLLKNISLVGIFWGAYTINERDAIARVWEGIMRLVDEGKLKGTVYTDDRFVGLDSVKGALQALASRKTWGKVVVQIPQGKESRL